MKALFYSDWCAIRGTFARLLVLCPIIIAPIAMMSGESGAESVGFLIATMVTMMISFYAMLGLFSADEQGDWEQVRLSLPITSRDVVRARYAFVSLMSLGAALLGAVLGVFTNGLFALVDGSAMRLDVLPVTGTALGMAAASIGYLALLMPMVFKIGISKARIYFSLPFFLIMLLNVEPVAEAFRGMIARLDHLTEMLGSPVPLVLAGAVIAGLVLVASLRISERIYAARDF